MSDTPPRPHSQQKPQRTRSPQQVSFANGMPNSLPSRGDGRVPMRRHLPSFVAVPPVLAHNGTGDITSPQSMFGPLLPQIAADLSVGGVTISTPVDNSDASFPFRAALGGIAVPLRRPHSTSEAGDPTINSARLEKEDAEEHARLLEEYRARFLRRQRQTRSNSINALTDGISTLGERDDCSLDAASSVKAPATCDLAMFQAMASAAGSTRSLAGCASLPESLGGVHDAAAGRRGTHAAENDVDEHNVTLCSATPQSLLDSKRSIDNGADDQSSCTSLTLAVTHGPAARSGAATHVRRFSPASERRTRKVGLLDVVQVRLSSLRPFQPHNDLRPLPQETQTPRANCSHTQRDLGVSNSYTFGADEQASGCSW